MADYKILCPACAAVLSSKKPIRNGKKITCPNCKKPFVAATSGAASSSDSGSLEFEFSPMAAASSSAPVKTAPAQAAAKPDKRRAPAKSGSKRALLIALVLLLVALAATGGALGVYFAMQPPASPVAHKAKEKKAADPKAEVKHAQAAHDKSKPAAQGRPKEQVATQAGGAVAKLSAKAEDGAHLAVNADVKAKSVAAVPAKALRRTADWKEFKSATGGYTVQFPSAPEEMKERDEDIIFYETKSGLNDTNYEITFYRLKKDELKMPIKERFNAFAEQYKATTKDKKEITLSGQPALELMLVDDKTRAFERWTVYKEHVFHIAVSGNKDTLGPDQVTRFLESFRFVADPQGRFLDITESTTIPEVKKK